MWKVLAHKYYNDKAKSPKVALGAIKDLDGEIAKALGVEIPSGSTDKSRIVFWKGGDESVPTLYDGEIFFTCIF